MTNKKHPDQFDWATELSDAQGHVTLSAQEANEIGARLRSMGEKLKAYEDLGGAADDVQLLRMGYAAARLKEAVGLLEELAEHDNYSTEYDGRMFSICPECGEQDGEHRPNCAFVRAKAFLAARKQGANHE